MSNVETTNTVASLDQGVTLPGIDSSTVVLVAGGSGAIGFRSAEVFSSLGAKVAIMSRTAESGADAKRRLGDSENLLSAVGDVSSQADAERVVNEVLARWGRLDVLVNCAAVGGNASLEDTDEERIDTILAANVKGTLLMAKAAAIPMREQGRGRIINVSSIMGHRSAPNSFLYGASKAAVGHATRALAVELGPSGITVNCVSPANTPSALRAFDEAPGSQADQPKQAAGAPTKIPLRRRGVLDDYVGPIVFFASELAAYVTGADVLSDGGLSLLRA